MTPTLILVGGFLGAGKTTLLVRAAEILRERELRVGLVTNDQADTLVDTALAQQQRVPVVEVAGGCFCCRFPDLHAALATLRRTVNPEVILAEPVGSCTDLMATVIRPLADYHAGEYRLAPLTVLLDPTTPVSRRPSPARAWPCATSLPSFRPRRIFVQFFSFRLFQPGCSAAHLSSLKNRL